VATNFLLEVVTPDRTFYDGEIDMLIVRTTEGDIAIMYDHELLVAPVTIGAIRIRKQGEEKFRDAACSGGFMTVSEEKTTVVTDSAEWADEIDLERAKAALERAQKRLETHNSEIDYARASSSLSRATNRIRVVEKIE
jgi:F-type H+-transporting ATPase subunit epsilon